MNTTYTGIGARKTPSHILKLMEDTARKLCTLGWTLRSGGARGADTAFERGVDLALANPPVDGDVTYSKYGTKEIFYANDATEEAMAIAKQYHPAWNRMGAYVKKLHGRNAFQVLGRNLKSPSRYLICWTPDGCTSHEQRTIKTGGTGTAISIASANKIEVINMAIPAELDRIERFVNSR